VQHQLHQGGARQFGKGRFAPPTAPFAAALRDLGCVGQAEAHPIEGHQTQAQIKGLSRGLFNRSKPAPPQLFEDFKGQGLTPFAQGAFSHLDSEQPEPMLAQGAGETDGEMEEDAG